MVGTQPPLDNVDPQASAWFDSFIIHSTFLLLIFLGMHILIKGLQSAAPKPLPQVPPKCSRQSQR